MSPNIICYLFSITSCGLILTTMHPIALADCMAKLRFYICSYTDLGLWFMAAGDIGGTLL